MAGKRKNPDTPVARVTRPHSQLLPRNRSVSIHTTAAGRLGQTTSFLPIADPPSPPAGSSNLSAHSILSTDDFPDLTAHSALEDDADREDQASQSDEDDTSLDDSPLQEWARLHRDSYLDEMIRHEGRAGANLCGEKCGREGVYKCKDCFGFQLFCCGCFTKKHSHLPLHRVLVCPCCHIACHLLILMNCAALEWWPFRRRPASNPRYQDASRSLR